MIIDEARKIGQWGKLKKKLFHWGNIIKYISIFFFNFNKNKILKVSCVCVCVGGGGGGGGV